MTDQSLTGGPHGLRLSGCSWLCAELDVRHGAGAQISYDGALAEKPIGACSRRFFVLGHELGLALKALGGAYPLLAPDDLVGQVSARVYCFLRWRARAERCRSSVEGKEPPPNSSRRARLRAGTLYQTDVLDEVRLRRCVSDLSRFHDDARPGDFIIPRDALIGGFGPAGRTWSMSSLGRFFGHPPARLNAITARRARPLSPDGGHLCHDGDLVCGRTAASGAGGSGHKGRPKGDTGQHDQPILWFLMAGSPYGFLL